MREAFINSTVRTVFEFPNTKRIGNYIGKYIQYLNNRCHTAPGPPEKKLFKSKIEESDRHLIGPAGLIKTDGRPGRRNVHNSQIWYIHPYIVNIQ